MWRMCLSGAQGQNGSGVSEVPSTLGAHPGGDQINPDYGLGASTHIAAPEPEKPASGDGGLVTFLGTVDDQSKDNEVITYLGEKPQEGTPEAAELVPTFEVVMADEIPDRNLPFIIHVKQKRRPVTTPIDALQAVQEAQVFGTLPSIGGLFCPQQLFVVTPIS